MAKLQIKSEKLTPFGGFFSGSWSKSADADTDSPKFRNPTSEGKRVKEKVYIYIYKYKNILLTFLHFSSLISPRIRCGKSDCKCQRQQSDGLEG